MVERAASSGEAQGMISETIRIPLRDGVRLVADIFRPDVPEKVPVIVEITPYRRGSAFTYRHDAAFWVARGYALAIVDTRGCGDSDGTFVFFAQEGEDGFDCVEWLAALPWCSGRVGMTGGSYSGTNQWFTAQLVPPHLCCINPNSTAARFMEELAYLGGALHLGWTLAWPLARRTPELAAKIDWAAILAHRPLYTADELVAGPEPLHRTVLDHPHLDDFWRALALPDGADGVVSVPSLAMSGWYDTTLSGTVHNFHRARRLAADPRQHHLVIGPWDHDSSRRCGWQRDSAAPMARHGDLETAEAAILPFNELLGQFYDAYLKGVGTFSAPPVALFLGGDDRWIEADDLPLAECREISLFLGAAGTLSEMPPNDFGATAFRHDPANPVPVVIDGRSLVGAPIDIAELGDRGDVLSFATAPLSAPVTVCGTARVTLHASADAYDCDFVVRLVDLYPDGRAICLGSMGGGVTRARYRNGFEATAALSPGEAFVVEVNLHQIGHVFAAGHRIGVMVCGSAWPFLSVNPGTGNPIATDTAEPRLVMQTILTGGATASDIRLPVINK
jgi:uncharacterized protein